MNKVVWKKKIKALFSLDIFLQFFLSALFALSVSWQIQEDFNITLFLLSSGLIFVILRVFWKRITSLKVGEQNPPKIKTWEFLIFAGLILAVLIIGIIARYPGGSSVDVAKQYTEALTNQYSNGHPVLHTLFLFKLPQLFYQGLISTTIFQCLIIFAILMYFCYFCRKNFLGFWPTLLALLLIIMNPTFTNYSVIPWKDILYSWAIMLSTLFLINIVVSKGDWLLRWCNKVFFILATIGVSCFRHNGIIPFVLIYLILAIFYVKLRKFSLVTGGGILLVFVIITGPIYSALGINGAGGAPEMMGVMMGQISHYYHYRSDEFSGEELAILEDVTPLQNWNENYSAANFNLIKFNHNKYKDDGENNTNKGVERNKNELIKIWLNKSMSNPKSFMKSYLNMTSSIWQSGRPMRETISEIDSESDLIDKGDMRLLSNQVQEKVIEYNRYIANTPFRFLFLDVGDGLMMIFFALALAVKKAGRNYRALLPFAVVLANTAVVMLVITGEEVRFVYSQILCAIPLLIYGLSDKFSLATRVNVGAEKDIGDTRMDDKKVKVRKIGIKRIKRIKGKEAR